MAIQFDGSGKLVRETRWLSSAVGAGRIIIKLQVPDNETAALGIAGRDTNRNSIFYNAESDTLRVRYDQEAGMIGNVTLGAVPIRDGVKHTLEFYRVGDELRLDFDGQVGFSTAQLENNPGRLSVQDFGYAAHDDLRMPAGAILHSIELVDTEDSSNNSVYLLDDGTGTVATDSGAAGINADLVGFTDAEAAWVDDGPPPRITFTDGDPDTRLRDRDGLLITAADVPIRVSTQRDPRGAPALTGAPVTMIITDGEATMDLSAADPMPVTGDAIYVEVFDQKATPEDDVSRRYVLRMQDGATAGE